MREQRFVILSLFPGIGLLDHAFELEWPDAAIVRGPDVLWGGDVRRFHVPPGRFDGVIGGPPCQSFSPIGNVNRARWGDDSVLPDLIPEFRRIVDEAQPAWWLMENSPHAYGPFAYGCNVTLDLAWLGYPQARRRRFWSNLRLPVDVPALVPPDSGSERAVTSRGSVDWKGSRARESKRSIDRCAVLQGLPADFLDDAPFTVAGKHQVIANGVPIPTGRAIARAVRRALGLPLAESEAVS